MILVELLEKGTDHGHVLFVDLSELAELVVQLLLDPVGDVPKLHLNVVDEHLVLVLSSLDELSPEAGLLGLLSELGVVSFAEDLNPDGFGVVTIILDNDSFEVVALELVDLVCENDSEGRRVLELLVLLPDGILEVTSLHLDVTE